MLSDLMFYVKKSDVFFRFPDFLGCKHANVWHA